ncbi:PAS domain-containing protein [Solicola sp. PLA-1-18]|uniref:PAS domain-containing protein n=1 Tax=Solicola sp. PLA-1-18 TaxID=3380532 RepID=UPI003B7F94BC
MRGDAERYVRAVTHGRDVPVGGYRYEIAADRWTLSDDVRRMLGLPEDEVMTTQTLVDFQHPDDTATVAEVADAVTQGRSFHQFYRIVTRTGRTLSVLGVGQVVDGEPDQGPMMVGYLIDLTPMARRSDLDREFAAVIADFDVLDEPARRHALLSKARGMLMGILDVDDAQASDLMRECATRTHTDEHTVAGHLVQHFQRATGIRRSLPELRHEVDDVLDQD